MLPQVWVGADRLGRSKGVGLVFARTADEARQLVRLLDGRSVGGRPLVARYEDAAERAAKIGLPRFRPRWLSKLRGEDQPSPPANYSNDVGAAW